MRLSLAEAQGVFMDPPDYTEQNWWHDAHPTVWMTPVVNQVLRHPPEAGKPGPLTTFPVAHASGGLFATADLIYTISATDPDELDCPQWSIRGRHGHPPGAKLEYFRAERGIVFVELHSTTQCGIVRLNRPQDTLPIDAGVWHAAWITPESKLQVVADGAEAFDIAFGTLPCSCDRVAFLKRHGLDPEIDPTLRA